jgi:hypothetical protein
MPIDPYWVYAYWEMSPQSAPRPLSGTEKENAEARHILRVSDVTFIDFDGTNAHNSFDIEITLQARNWYINLWSPDKSLCAELGLLHRDGTFFPLVRSNVIQIPPAWASPNMEEHWLRVGRKDLTPGQDVSSHEAIDSAPRVGPPPPPLSRSAGLERSSLEGFQPNAQERSPDPGIEAAETLPHPKEAVQAEEYRRFLESSRRMRILGGNEPALPMAWSPSVDHSGGLPEPGGAPEIGLSSKELVKEG